jgi:response regulator RpfG family c-di-GMP phosphodiesterase
MASKILFVDDDENVLSGLQRNLRKSYDVVTAASADLALEILQKDPSFAVIVSDYRMPVMNGADFLCQTAAKWPDSARILLTGEADMKGAAAAVNKGQIFRFLTKPCPALTMEKTLEEAVRHHELATAEKLLLERTLRGSMEVLTEILNLVQPVAFSRANAVYRLAKELIAAVNPPNAWEFEIAAMLCHLGCITIPLDILSKVSRGQNLSDKESAIYQSHPEAGGRLLANVPRLELVAEIIAHQAKPSGTMPAWMELDDFDRLTIGSHLLKLAVEIEAGISRGLTKAAVLLELSGNGCHPALLKAAEEIEFCSVARNCRTIPSHRLASGMILDADVNGETGILLVAKGQRLSDTLIEYLQRRLEYAGSEQMVRVRVPAEQLAAIDKLFGRA